MSSNVNTSKPIRGNKPFGRFLASSAFESLGDGTIRTLLPLIAVSALGAGTFHIGLLNAIGLSAFSILGLPVGVLADTLPRLRLMFLADILRAALLLAIPASYFLGFLQLWHLIAIAGVLSICDVIFISASGAAIPDLVGPRQVSEAYAQLHRVSSATSLGSPILVTGLLKILAAPFVLLIGSIGYLMSGLALPRLLPPEPGTAKPQIQPFWASLRLGMLTTLQQPIMRQPLFSGMLLNAATMLGNSVLAVYAMRDLGFQPATFAMLGVFGAGGGLAAGLAAPKLLALYGIGPLRVTATLLCIPAVSLQPLATILPGNAIIWCATSSFSWAFLLILASVAGAGIIPQLCDSSNLGTVMASNRFFTLGIMPIASIIGGSLATLIGPAPILWAWALLAGCSALPIIYSPIRSWQEVPDSPTVTETKNRAPREESIPHRNTDL
ncbi:hypothetical protein CQ018_02840 [Arthrobacter sp. MYb227]|uniref:MFS transporter n=1 Tax=Arthrobacter sp. MYb227 TaxID=1848601 RepID=UPI000CFCF8AC|nr:MFS transporter [Arthrobacter sp. MYb227]PQZ96230.1 hypothetical protein CQ018_02840 [Arthrobacter sp. MYb227]